MFILDRIDRELHSLKRLELKLGLSPELSEFFHKIPVRILLYVLFRVFRFFKSLFYALTSSFMKLTGAPNDRFLLNALITLFGLFRVLLDV